MLCIINSRMPSCKKIWLTVFGTTPNMNTRREKKRVLSFVATKMIVSMILCISLVSYTV